MDGNFVGTREHTSDRNMEDLEDLAEACDRFEVDDNAAAYICNAHLKGLKLLTVQNTLDRKKVARHRAKYREKSRLEELERQKREKITAIYHDGHRDKDVSQESYQWYFTESS